MVYPSWLCYTRHDRASPGVLVGGYNVLTKVGSRTLSQFEQQRQRSPSGIRAQHVFHLAAAPSSDWG